MSNQRIARRYARALFRVNEGNLEQARTDLNAMIEMRALFEFDDSGRILRSPAMPPDIKRQIMDYGLERVQATTDLKSLVYTVLDAGRINVFPEIIESYSDLVDEAQGINRAEVSAAVALEPEDISHLEGELSRLFKKKIQVHNVVDKSLLGGFVVRVGNQLIDMSLRSRLDALSQSAAQDSLR